MVHNTRVKPLVCTFSPANTLATPVSLRLTADAIMQDLAPVAPNRLLTPWLVVGCCWSSANTQPMKFGRAPSTSMMDCCTRRQCQHSPAAPTGARGDPQPSPPEGGRLGALAGRESAARSSCSFGSQAWPAIAYGCDIPNFAACSPVVQQHDYGKDHRGTLQHARSTRSSCRRIHRRHGEQDLQDGRASAPLWCWACYRRPCPAQAAGNLPRSHAWWPCGSAKRWSSSQKSGGGGADQPHGTRRSISPLPVGQIAQTDRLTRFF